MDRYLLDTNVVLRSIDVRAPEHPRLKNALATLTGRGDVPCLTPQVLIEFWNVATRPVSANGFGWDVTTTETEVRRLLGTFTLLPDTPDVFPNWLRIVAGRGVTGKQVHDARLVAIMTVHGVTQLVTLNISDFRNYG